ncbi:MAG: formate C-acetyltransferase/glycerol dehydratase family glycyl radical enzyme [Deltaproteobacteria bacterium]|nr:formate C-acetyltransferase/glycerol dehydratase family glycyl radical enzyme [Deltaproteobacteria bacterium]
MANGTPAFRNIRCAMSDRIARLRENLLLARPEVFAERAILLTEAYRDTIDDLPELQRAKALAHVLQNTDIRIRPGELIVGSKVPLPKGSPVYPEFNIQWLEQELETLAERKETPFHVSEVTKKELAEKVIPYWKGKTVYDYILKEAPHKALAAAGEGLFFHYYIDRSIGHISVNYEKVLQSGLLGLKARIKEQQDLLSRTQKDYPRKSAFYDGLLIVADAAIEFSHRYADLAYKLAASCDNPVRRAEMEHIAAICRRVPEYPAETFHEALQSFWFIHLILNLESNSYAISPGRFCQYIFPYYENDEKSGVLDASGAQELINCLWIKFNEMTVVKAGATAKASNTYVDFQNLNIGGITADGRDGTNAVSYFCLNALEALKLPQPQVSCLISSKTEKSFLLRAAEVIRGGTGMPAMFNDDVKVVSLMAGGKSLSDARRGGVNGCVEINAQGCDNMASTGYVNLAKCLELAMNDGVSMISGRRLGPRTGRVETFSSIDQVMDAFSKQLKAAVALKVSYDKAARRAFARYCPVIFTSLVMDDCIAKGQDFHQGGARYNAPMLCGVGLGTLADSLAAINENCFVRRNYTLAQVREALLDNFASHPLMRRQLNRKSPKFGNNDDRADHWAALAVTTFCDILDTHVSEYGESYRANMIPTTTHIPLGHDTAATADGRFAGAPLSEGVSPVQGKDIKGPTGVIQSLAKLDHGRTAGTLLNMKFTPSILDSEEKLEKFSELVRTYFALGGYHMQFNVVSRQTLIDAQQNPEAYRSLIIRVAGYSDYFNSLSKSVQDEIITRTTFGEA